MFVDADAATPLFTLLVADAMPLRLLPRHAMSC